MRELWLCPMCGYQWSAEKYDAMMTPKLMCPVCYDAKRVRLLAVVPEGAKVPNASQNEPAMIPAIDGDFYSLFGGK